MSSETVVNQSLKAFATGKYLIINLKHTIDVSKYVTTITAVKDSYKDPIPKTTLRQESDSGFPHPNLL